MTLCKLFFNTLLIGLCLASAASATTQQQAIGQRLYREGITGSGAPLQAQGAGQAQLGGATAACVACHRRSGYGGSEGQLTVRPITAAALFEEQTLAVRSPRIKAQLGSRQRPAYNAALLARAIRQGIDSAGKPLDPLMPRFALGDDDLAALGAYLATLSAQSSPGVDEQEIHFATVIQPGVTPERRRAMLDIMQAFFKDKGANVRQDEQRREAGNMRMYRAYRKWVLHVWDLSGPSDSWGAQLDAYYAAQPVFALIAGLGSASWRPVHAFSERYEVPSVFAQADVADSTSANQYNLYFSKGVALESEVLAKFLREPASAARLVQVYRRDDAGTAASGALRAALAAGVTLQDEVLEGAADAAFWRRVFGANADAYVLWLGAKDLQGVPAGGTTSVPVVYLSSQLLGGKPGAALPAALAGARLIYASDLPPKHEARLLRSKIWLHNKGIAVTDEVVQINTLFALTVASDALGHMMDSFSRDFFVERIEHAVAQTPTPSQYQSVSLGPGQRYAAKGSSIVQLGYDGSKASMTPLSGWIVP